jgi:RNA polymerase sigma-70 factor (ECF subfamily)
VVDKALIESVKKKEPDAFKKMYEACIRYVYSIVVRYVSNSSDHQDVVQEIFARVFLKVKSYDAEKGEFKFWLRRLTINQCIKHYHKTQASLDLVPIDNKAMGQVDVNSHSNALTKDELLKLLSAMPSGYKEIFMLVTLDDYSHKEVGEMLNISPETSRSQLHRAKKWLKENLSTDTLNLMTSVI